MTTLSGKKWLLWAWLYGLPSSLMIFVIQMYWFSNSEVAFCRYIATPTLILIILFLLSSGRKEEMKKGMTLLPDGQAFGKYLVFFVLALFVIVLGYQLHRPAGSATIALILAGAPHSSIFSAKKKPEVLA